MRVIVTGAEGFVGKHLLTELFKQGHHVIPIDHHLGSDAITALEPNIRSYKPGLVIHLAAKVGRLFGEDDVMETAAANVGLTMHVAKVCGEHGVRLAYASTSEVYGDNGNDSVDEYEGPFSLPHNAYGMSKKWGEDACRLYAPERLLIWRLSMPYGPGLLAGRGRAALVNFLYNAIHGLPITVHRDSERSWCWVGDTVRGMLATLSTDGGTFNVGRDDNATKMLKVATMCCRITGADVRLIEEIDAPARQTVVKRLSTDRLRALGWKPEVTLEEGMRRTLVWVESLPAPAELLVA